jgi:phenylacetate-CoA ligase
VFCGSEKTFQNQRKIIEEVFDTSVFSWYGHSENCVLGGECEYSHSYHLFPQYGYVEFLEVKKEFNKTLEGIYEIVATGFNNWIMPFIRYKTGDYAVLKDSNCECGRNYPLIQEVIGRAQEFVLDKNENLISVTALTSLYEKLPFIFEAQILQEIPGALTFLIKPSYNPPTDELDKFISMIETKTQNRLKVNVQFINEIPKSSSMKRRIVDQKIDISSYLN